MDSYREDDFRTRFEGVYDEPLSGYSDNLEQAVHEYEQMLAYDEAIRRKDYEREMEYFDLKEKLRKKYTEQYDTQMKKCKEDMELAKTPEEKSEVQKNIENLEKNRRDALLVVERIGDIVRSSKEIIPKEKQNEWFEIMERELNNYNLNPFDSPDRGNQGLAGFLHAGRILFLAQEKRPDAAQKEFKADGNTDIWDFDTQLVLHFGDEKAAMAYKDSERYKQKVEMHPELKTEIDKFLEGKINQKARQ